MTEDEPMEAFEGELHDPLAEDLTRIVETWGLATLIHGVKCMALMAAERPPLLSAVILVSTFASRGNSPPPPGV